MIFTLFKKQFHKEKIITNAKFNIIKFNSRIKPKCKDKILILSCFSEFGCEVIGCMYSIPRITRKYPGRYIIAVGWYGREYLYRKLVDEFWEIDKDLMYLRNYGNAFEPNSLNIKNIEKKISNYGISLNTNFLGNYVVGNYCMTCGYRWNEWKVPTKKCSRCTSTVIVNSVFSNTEKYKEHAVRIPKPSDKWISWAKEFIKPNTVGIFARNRIKYGRNLPISFYQKIISTLKDNGYNIVWLGEEINVYPCPDKSILDFSRMPESRDIEKTLSIISLLKFTIQFFTASTRLSAIVDTPYILFESPEQIYCTGSHASQEGKRLDLVTFGPKKLVLSHFLNVLENEKESLEYLNKAIDDLNNKNYDDIIGLVQDKELIKKMQDSYRRYC